MAFLLRFNFGSQENLSIFCAGNSLEFSQLQERLSPAPVTDPSARTETTTIDMRMGLLDDFTYFVDEREGTAGLLQAMADTEETAEKVFVELQKSYSEYRGSLINARTLRNEIKTKNRTLLLMTKKNQLYEVSTLQLMEETQKFAEATSNYTKALNTNYSAVATMERMTLVPLR